MKKAGRMIAAAVLGIAAMCAPFAVRAASVSVPDQAMQKVERRAKDVERVYQEIFSSTKQDPTLVTYQSEESKRVPVALTKLDNGKIAYLVNGEAFYPRGIETGWWDVRVDDNGGNVGDSGNVGEHFKLISDEEWTGYFRDMKQMGFNTVQLMIYWKDFQPISPFGEGAPTGDARYDWTFLDNVTKLASDAGLKMELVVFFHSQTDNIPKEMDQFWGYQFDTFEDAQGKWSMSMQWGFDGSKGKVASAEDVRHLRDTGGGWGVENFLEYWHPDLYDQMTDALTALGKHFKDSDCVIGYQIGNEEGFNPNVDSGRDHNPYYTKMKELWMAEHPGKNETEFRAALVNSLWASFTNALRAGDPYKPTTTNIQSSAMEESGWGLPGKPIAGNDGTQMDFYRSVDMVGPMFYGNGENKLNNLDLAFNTTGQGFATSFPVLFPSEIGAYHQGGAVANQVSAMTAARGGAGMGFYCYGELYNDFEAKGMSQPKPERGCVVTLQHTLQDVEDMLWAGLPVNESQASGLFMKQKSITIDSGKPTLSVLEVPQGKILGVMHFPGNSGNAGDTQKRTVTAELIVKEAGTYKLTLYQTDGTVTSQRLEAQQPGSVEFTFETTGAQATYIKAGKVDPNDPDQPVLDGIQLVSPPTKTVYMPGESFSADGMILRASYTDGTKKTLNASDVTFSGFDSSRPGIQQITVSYTEGEKTFTASFEIRVEQSRQSTNFTLYKSGSLEWLFDGQTNTQQVDFRATEEDYAKMKAGEMYIEYAFQDVVSLKGIDFWTNYAQGQGPTSVKVAVPDAEGTGWQFISEQPFSITWNTSITDSTFEEQSISWKPVQTDRVRVYVLDAHRHWEHPDFGKKFALFEMEMNYDSNVLESIEVTKLPDKVEYTLFGSLDTAGMIVTARYDDGSTRDVTQQVTVSPLEALTPGTKTITVSFGGKTAAFEVKVVPTLSLITVTPPTKTTYHVGEPFDPAGMVVTATYDYGNAEDVTEHVQVSGFDSSTPGEKTVTVSYQEKTAEFKVTVLENEPAEKAASEMSLTAIEIASPAKTEYQIGQSFDASEMKVTAVYSDGSKKEIEADQVSITGFDSSSAGEKTITVAYQDQTAQFTVLVNAG